jgi:hypothetical protein
MKITERLQGVARLFLDTAPVVYYVEKNPHYIARVQGSLAKLMRVRLPP